MIAINTQQNGNGSSGGGWEDILGRVLGGINGAANPGSVVIQGSTPTVYDPVTGATDYTPLILIAVVIVAIVLLSRK